MTSRSATPEGKPPIDKVGLCLIRGGNLLVARNADGEVFQIPGGKVEAFDADDLAALQREIHEELGVAVIPDSAVRLGRFSDRAANDPARLVTVKLFEARISGTIRASSEIGDIQWIDLDNSGNLPLSAVLRDKILPFLRGRLCRAADADPAVLSSGGPKPIRP